VSSASPLTVACKLGTAWVALHVDGPAVCPALLDEQSKMSKLQVAVHGRVRRVGLPLTGAEFDLCLLMPLLGLQRSNGTLTVQVSDLHARTQRFEVAMQEAQQVQRW
jgi:hypothetical protein